MKSRVGYYRLLEIATGSDAMEVMFKRADALAGELGSDGFIPDAMLSTLARKPGQARKIADGLVDTGLWVRVDGGYVIVDWVTINSELKRLQDRKKRDRDRKRAERAASRTSTDVSADSPVDGPVDGPGDSLYESERKTKKKTAAAAAEPAAAAAAVPTAVEILRSKIQAHTPLRGLRFDALTPEQTDRLTALLETHGDDPLVAVAISTCRHPAPTSVTAFLGTWEAMPPPGRALHVVRPKRCDIHGTQLTPSGNCNACAADARAKEH